MPYSIRISGVVKVMNNVRRALTEGIPVAELNNLRTMVHETVVQVEDICRKHRIKPNKLPAPTYRAYRYLKELDLKNLPVRSSEAQPGRRFTPRIHNLISNVNDLQNEISQLTQKTTAGQAAGDLLKRIQNTLQQVNGLLHGANPADLPAPSRRAYFWLHFLAQPGHLQSHLQTLRRMGRTLEKTGCQVKALRAIRHLPVRFMLYNQPNLYRSRVVDGELHVVAHEAFLGAPGEIIQSLVCSSIGAKSEDFLSRLRKYAVGAEFSRLAQLMESAATLPQSSTAGQFFDLEEIFKRVNHQYFQGKMERPRLTWNRTLTRRIFGHYLPDTDTVMISISLDRSGVPPYVIEYVMYHELLHKKLGIRQKNGRSYSHTAAFRAEEQKFIHYQQAEAFLKGNHKNEPL